jgi:hypothetical protein
MNDREPPDLYAFLMVLAALAFAVAVAVALLTSCHGPGRGL